MNVSDTRSWVRKGGAIFSLTAPWIETEFVELVGRIELNELAAFGSAALAGNDE